MMNGVTLSRYRQWRNATSLSNFRGVKLVFLLGAFWAYFITLFNGVHGIGLLLISPSTLVFYAVARTALFHAKGKPQPEYGAGVLILQAYAVKRGGPAKLVEAGSGTPQNRGDAGQNYGPWCVVQGGRVADRNYQRESTAR